MNTQICWTPVTTRPLTEEEQAIFGEYLSLMLDGDLPRHGQVVLVSGIWGVDLTVFYNEEFCAFDSYDAGEVFAWASLPEPYSGGGV